MSVAWGSMRWNKPFIRGILNAAILQAIVFAIVFFLVYHSSLWKH
jgi:hypothetical protein